MYIKNGFIQCFRSLRHDLDRFIIAHKSLIRHERNSLIQIIVFMKIHQTNILKYYLIKFVVLSISGYYWIFGSKLLSSLLLGNKQQNFLILNFGKMCILQIPRAALCLRWHLNMDILCYEFGCSIQVFAIPGMGWGVSVCYMCIFNLNGPSGFIGLQHISYKHTLQALAPGPAETQMLLPNSQYITTIFRCHFSLVVPFSKTGQNHSHSCKYQHENQWLFV